MVVDCVDCWWCWTFCVCWQSRTVQSSNSAHMHTGWSPARCASSAQHADSTPASVQWRRTKSTQLTIVIDAWPSLWLATHHWGRRRLVVFGTRKPHVSEWWKSSSFCCGWRGTWLTSFFCSTLQRDTDTGVFNTVRSWILKKNLDRPLQLIFTVCFVCVCWCSL